MGESKTKFDGPQDLKFALLLATGRTVAEAAQEAGFTYRVGRRRMENSEFREVVKTARAGLLEEALGELTTLSKESAKRLRVMIQSEDPKTALKAIEIVYAARTSVAGEFDHEERIAALEGKKQ